MRVNLKVEGINRTINEKILDKALESDLDKITETYARKIVNEAAEKAPILTGLLRNSLISGLKRSDSAKIGVWDLVSGTEYTLRQEYEHASKAGFIRSSIWDNQDAYKSAITNRVKRRR